MNNTKTGKHTESWLAAILVVVVTLITYAPLISQLGFYRDDWYLIWTAMSRGAEGILSLFAGDRPFLGWLYVFDYRLLGASPLNWHVYALLIKVISALAFLWLLRSLWPARKIETVFMTLLFIVYPGFYQQPNALTFKNLLLSYAAAMLSLALTIQALRTKTFAWKAGLTFLSLLLAAFYIFIFEAFIGIEAVRLMLIGYYLGRSMGFGNWKALLRRTAAESAPYLVFAGAFVFWRIFLFDSTRRATNVDVLVSQYYTPSLHNIARLLIEMVKDLVETTFLAWGVPFYQFVASETEYRIIAAALITAAAILAVSAAYYFLFKRQADAPVREEEKPQDAKDWIVLGALTIVLTTIPIILAGRNVIFGVQWDRYTYQSAFGVAILMGGLVFYAIRGRLRWVFLAALLVTGVFTQYLSANYYRIFWSLERDAMWQLSWRAPQITEGTTVVIALPDGYRFAEEYEVWGPTNLVYHPGEELSIPGQVPFDGIALDLARGTEEVRTVRGTIDVPRDYGRVVILSQPTPRSCLHLLDGRRADQVVTDSLDVRIIAQYSNVDLIDPAGTPAVPPAEIFGSGPERNWCYYYQKIDLARQSLDWQAAARLADETQSLGLEPSDPTEWLPALEAYLHVKDEKQAKRIVKLIRMNKTVYVGLCEQIGQLQDKTAEYDRQLLFGTLCQR